MSKLRVLVTGANGFLGGALFGHLCRQNDLECMGTVRSRAHGADGTENIIVAGELSADVDWHSVASDQDVIIHTAARAHIMKDEVSDPLAEYRKVNVEGTLNLAQQAAAAGVKRFIFISSIKVNGEQTLLNQPFVSDADPAPED